MKKLGLAVLLVAIIGVQMAYGGKKCFKVLSSCPQRGCAKEDTANAFANILKHNTDPTGQAKTLTFDDFDKLQTQVETKFSGHYATLTKADRVRLRNMSAGGGKVGEGSLVQVGGFIASLPPGSEPHPNEAGESVNCNLTGPDNNDFHISLTPKSGGSEYDGIVVEMIPQKRNPDWTKARLKDVQKSKREVRVRGQLFFDNHHTVNKDPHHPIGKQPKRMSLWEVHPILEFEVCTAASCDIATDSGWTKIEDWKGSTP